MQNIASVKTEADMLEHLNMQDMATIVREADIVVAAAGSPGLIRGSWLKQGAVLIDVGTNSVDDPSKKSGYRLVGDADFESCKQVCAAHFRMCLVKVLRWRAPSPHAPPAGFSLVQTFQLVWHRIWWFNFSSSAVG
jgi:hypothetical protein